MPTPRTSTPACYQLCFRSLSQEGRGLSFPCDAEGHIAFDRLSDRARNDYFFARVCIGHAYASPTVEPTPLH
ncbi:hypothetical protein HLB44_14140 [Aquincola sp. S2]|uniref:Uncharacterized protein n=1 Tax=Pseudaquabacterium terrae TaxID=2732868 RepID=A0ABX2EHN1_9BURK|nr:hypothetical protein [Aquabacterium terrae]NRF68129.1 hypothetical protein [Aquabacterium terrae]